TLRGLDQPEGQSAGDRLGCCQKRLAGPGVRLLGRVEAIAETSASHPRRSNDGVDDRRCGRRRQKQERSGSQLYHHRDASLRKARRSLADGFSPRILLGMASINWFKLILTYCVPYVVCTYGAVSYRLKNADVTLERSA